MNKEALKLAIQLRDTASWYWTENEIPIIEKLIELLAQPAQEPVGCFVKAEHGDYPILHWHKPYVAKVGDNLYTTPPQPAQEPVTWAGVDFDINITLPQRPWVGLTAEEAAECWTTTATQTWKNIENALRIKNT